MMVGTLGKVWRGSNHVTGKGVSSSAPRSYIDSFMVYAFLKEPCAAGRSEHCILTEKIVPSKISTCFLKNMLIGPLSDMHLG